jgi:hypothetical protein
MAMPSLSSGHQTLSELAQDYAYAEITALWVYEVATRRHILALVVVELCPREQEPSPLFQSRDIKRGTSVPMKRAELSPERKAYVARIRLEDPQEAVTFYRGDQGNWPLPKPLQEVRLEPPGPLVEEPPAEIPNLVPHVDDDSSFGAMLPLRPGSLRVYSRLEPKGLLRKYLRPQELESLDAFAREMLGVDLLRFSEYQGAIQLCLPNPLVRGVQEYLAADEQNLLVEFLERDGCSVSGCTLELTDLQASGKGFHLRVPVTGPHLIVPFPYPPRSLRTRLLNPAGDCIHESTGAFLSESSLRIQAQLGGHVRNFTIKSRDGSEEQYTVKTVAGEHPRYAEEDEERTVARLLREARGQRQLENLEQSRTFVYFEGGAESKQRASAIVRELLGQVQRRCLICDPYLSSGDVARFAPFVRIQRLPIRLLGARFFLKQEIQKDSEETEGDALLRCIRQLTDLDPTLVLSCRVLRGSQKSPVHDRFLVVDDDVYLLGSSLNEFGARATTLFKVPDPQRLIAETESWWNDPQRSVPLEELRTLPPEPEDDDEAVE